MWRTHKNRVDKGLGGTYNSSGFHDNMSQDKNVIIPANFVTMEQVITGADVNHYFENPLFRWHKSFEEYPSHLSDIDDHAMHKTDQFEKFKKYKPLDKHIVGSS